MSQSQDFSAADDWSRTPEERHQQSQDEDVPGTSRALLLVQEGLRLGHQGKYNQAIARYNTAVELKPDYWEAWYHRGVALSYLGGYKEAIVSYDKVIALKPDSYEALSDKGYTLCILGRPKEGLTHCEKALKIHSNSYRVWWQRGYILRLLNRKKEALASCEKALELQPDSHEVWNAKGLVLLLLNRPKEALTSFENALEFQPDYAKAYYNRGLVLLKLGRNEAALSSFEKAINIQPDCQEFWYPQLWYARGYMLARFGRYEDAIDNFEKALELHPNYPPAAFYKLIILIFTGKIFNHLANSSTRKKIGKEIKVILNSIKYFLLGIFGFILLSNFTQITWIAVIKEIFSIAFSLGIIGLFVWELWKNLENLSFVWNTYKRGFLTYLRAFCIVIITITTLSVATPIVPPFLQWGWASAVFGNSGNIIFQPFNTIQKVKPAPTVEVPEQSLSKAESSSQSVKPSPSRKAPSAPSDKVGNPSQSERVTPQAFEQDKAINKPQNNFDYSVILIVGLWIVMVLLLPFWANLEEKIFRQGGNTWKQIMIRSTLFGLVHILVGIPIFAGFVLIIPGFLFACRYKYVHDRQLRKNNDEKLAQEAGVEASTADHAIYNAILISLAVAAILFVNG